MGAGGWAAAQADCKLIRKLANLASRHRAASQHASQFGSPARGRKLDSFFYPFFYGRILVYSCTRRAVMVLLYNSSM